MPATPHPAESASDTIARLTAENEALRSSLVEVGTTAPRDWRLTAFEDKIFRMLLKSPVVTKAGMMAVLYADSGMRPAQKLMDVYVHRIRKKTKAHNLEIQTILGVGYSLTDREVWLKALKIGASETHH